MTRKDRSEKCALNVPEISVVIPCYNEEENAKAIVAATVQELEGMGITNFEVVVIDNASTDSTAAVIRECCAYDCRVKLIVNSRNFGQLRSPAHAIYQTTGQAIIGISADFQDPPELIPQLISGWREGYDIVLGVREDEIVSRRLRITRAICYWLASKLSDYPLIPQATGFGLYTRRVVDFASNLAEPDPLFRGLLVESGFPVKTIGYTRPPRAAGASKNDIFSLLSFAMSAFAGSSRRLLQLPLYVGMFGMLMSAVMLLGGGIAFVYGFPIAGWLIGAVVQFEFALLFGLIGLLGVNLRLVSERTRRTPLVVEKERVNFPSDGH